MITVCLVVATAIAAGALTTDPLGLRIAFAGCVAVAVGAAALRRPILMLYGLAVWLPLLGLVRRLATEIGATGRLDPLLLVAPLMLGLVCAAAIQRRSLNDQTPLTKAVLVLTVLIVLGALNPLQGSLLNGFSGLLFVLVPTLAFWAGRTYCDDVVLRRVFLLVGAIAIPTALYGLAQTFAGFPSWDARWIRESGYTSLGVGSTTRAFGSFSSAAEYAFFAGVGLVVWIGFGLKRGWGVVAAICACILSTAIFFESSRGIIFALFVTLAVVACARRRIALPAAILGSALIALALPFLVRAVAPSSFGAGNASQLAAHEVGGLANPLDPNSSTLLIHLGLVESGLRSSISNPLGLGVGAITISGKKFGGLVSGTEFDPSNAAVALGIPGLLAYLAVLVFGFRLAYAVAARRGDRLALVALGVLTLTTSQWLNGGQYAIAWLPWLVLGWFDRQSERKAVDAI